MAGTATTAWAAECEDCPGGPGADPGGGGGTGGGPGPATRVTGTFTYTDSGPAGGTFSRPVAFARVEVWAYRPRALGAWAWGVDFSTATDQNGTFLVGVPYTPGVEFGVRVFAANDAAELIVSPAIGPRWTEPTPATGRTQTATSPNDSLDFTFTFTGFDASAFNVVEAARHGRDFAQARRSPGESDSIGRAVFQVIPAGTSFYYPSGQMVMLNGADLVADFTVLHEYAHFLQDRIGAFPWIPARHDGCEAWSVNQINSPEHAWMEGFADWFAQAAGEAAPAAGLAGATGTPSKQSLETPTCGPVGFPGSTVENYVAGVLWDLTDPVGTGAEATDQLAGHDATIIGIMDRELDVAPGAGPWPSISTFRDAWVARGLPAGILDDLMVLNHVYQVDRPPTVDVPPPSDQVCRLRPRTPGC